MLSWIVVQRLENTIHESTQKPARDFAVTACDGYADSRKFRINRLQNND